MTIEIPDNCELKQEDGKYVIVEKKPTNYNDVARKLFNNKYYFINDCGHIKHFSNCTTNRDFYDECLCDANNASSEKQLQKLLAINKLMNVAKYLNKDWHLDWNDHSLKWSFEIRDNERILCTSSWYHSQISPVYFKTKELAKQAIEILGEETIRLALCTDY